MKVMTRPIAVPQASNRLAPRKTVHPLPREWMGRAAHASGIGRRRIDRGRDAPATRWRGGSYVRCERSRFYSATTEELDVAFDGETCTIEGWVRLATVYDPEGNTLML